MSSLPFCITATGCYRPERNVSSEEIDALLQFFPGSTREKHHITDRRWGQKHETTLFMAKQAADEAMQKGGLCIDDIDCIINAGCLVPQIVPNTASLFLAQYATSRQDCFDVDCTCLSFVKSLQVAIQLLQSDEYRHILIFSSELPSYGVTPADPVTFSLFGDGAAAMIVSRVENGSGSRLLGSLFQTFPDAGANSQCRGGGTLTHIRVVDEPDKDSFLFEMNGPQLFKIAAKKFPGFLQQLLDKTQCGMEKIRHVVPHQASYQSIVQMQKRLGISDESIVNIIGTYGNQVAASIPNALHHLLQQGNVQKEDTILILGAAAGVTLGGMLLEY